MTGPHLSVGIIGGGGWLGSALAIAALDAGLIEAGTLTLSSRSGSGKHPRLSGARWTADNQALVDASDVVVVSVRPDQFATLRVDARHRTVVSVMAGVSVRALVDRLGTRRVVRAMPNAAAGIRRSYTPWFATPEVPERDREAVRSLFACCGTLDAVPTEDHIDYLTALTGTGPAFPALLADALLRDAVGAGLDPLVARRAVEGVVVGASQLIEGRLPADVLKPFLDYRGITAAAIEATLDAGLPDAVRAGLVAARSCLGEMSRRGGGPCSGFRPAGNLGPV